MKLNYTEEDQKEFEKIVQKFNDKKITVIELLDELSQKKIIIDSIKFQQMHEQAQDERPFLGWSIRTFEKMYKNPRFLVRPHDYHIWELDESNNCYRSYSTRSVTYSDGTRPNASTSHTYEVLVRNFDFIPITEEELPEYEAKHEYHCGFNSWLSRSDGHGGCKGGTEEEYAKYLKRVEEYNKNK